MASHTMVLNKYYSSNSYCSIPKYIVILSATVKRWAEFFNEACYWHDRAYAGLDPVDSRKQADDLFYSRMLRIASKRARPGMHVAAKDIYTFVRKYGWMFWALAYQQRKLNQLRR